MFMCVKLSSLFDREIKVYYVPHMLKQCFSIKTMCANYILFINTTLHLLQVHLGVWANIETVTVKL